MSDEPNIYEKPDENSPKERSRDQSFLQKYLFPQTSHESMVLVLLIINIIGLIVFLFFAYTKWRY